MTDKFLTFIAERRAKLLKQKQKLDAELVELDRSEKLYRASGAVVSAAPVIPPPSRVEKVSPFLNLMPEEKYEAIFDEPRPGTKGTIKMRVRMLLARHPQGLTSQQILEHLQADGLPELQRTSLSPQLSRLRKETVIDQVSGLWQLTQSSGAEDDSQSPSAPDSPA